MYNVTYFRCVKGLSGLDSVYAMRQVIFNIGALKMQNISIGYFDNFVLCKDSPLPFPIPACKMKLNIVKDK